MNSQDKRSLLTYELFYKVGEQLMKTSNFVDLPMNFLNCCRLLILIDRPGNHTVNLDAKTLSMELN